MKIRVTANSGQTAEESVILPLVTLEYGEDLLELTEEQAKLMCLTIAGLWKEARDK